MNEIWKPIPGFAFYEASSAGRVRSIDREVRTGRDPSATFIRKGKVLKPIPNKGYLVVKLGGPNKAYGVHQEVALAFHGEPPTGHVVDHVDTNKLNNRPENLEYVTNSENVKRQYQTGLLTNKAGGIGRWKNLTGGSAS